MKIGKNPPFLVKCTPFSQMKFFPNILAIYIGQEHDLCFFEKFDPLYAIVMAYKWLTFEKSVPHPSKTIKNFKKLEMVRCLKFNFVLFRKFWSNLETLFVEKEKNRKVPFELDAQAQGHWKWIFWIDKIWVSICQ